MFRSFLNRFLSRKTNRKPARATTRPCVEVLEDRTVPATLLALNSATNQLLRFDSSTPATVVATTITNLNGGETVLGIDFRPSNGLLYGVTSQNRLLTINASTGAASLVAALTADPTDSTSPFTALNGTAFGVDFNPVPDRLRVVSDTNQNLRINPDNGLVITDSDLNPGTPDVVASAYTNNFAGTTATTLYGIDAASDSLVIQNPPNNGTLTTVGSGLGSGIDATLNTGFDIVTTGGPSRTNTAYATLVSGGVTGLYQIDLTAGTASSLGTIGSGTAQLAGLAVVPAGTLNFSVESYVVNENGGTATITVTRTGGSLGAVNVDFAATAGSATAGADFTAGTGTLMFGDGDTTPKVFTVSILDDMLAEGAETINLALSNATNGAVIGARGNAALIIRDNETPPVLLYAVTADNRLLEFASETPGVIRRSMPILNLNTGDVIEGIDFRPANGQLYALVVNGTTSRLVTISTLTGVASNVATLTADPTDSTSPFMALAGVDFGFDFNPTNDRIRIVSDADENLAVNPDNGFVTTQTTITGGTPNAVGSAYTNSFAGAGSTTLFAIDSGTDSLYTQNPPANGVLTLVGALGFDTSGMVGFEINPVNNQAFASLTAPAATTSSLFSINLGSGAASRIGTIGGGTTINGLASQTVNELNFSDNERFVNRLYRDLLGRNAEDSGRIGFTQFLNAGGSRSAVALAILNSPEYRGLIVEDLYQRLLHRASDAAGKAGFVAALANGATIQQVTAIIVGSPEYFQINGGTNASFLAAVYRDLLGRPIDANGQMSFTAALNAGVSRQAVAGAILGSPEYFTNLVSDYYRFFLLRNPDATGLAGFVAALQAGVNSNMVVAGLLSSPEYFARAL